MIRSFNHPVLFSARSLRVVVVTLRSPLVWRRLAWKVRVHPELALRAFGLELVRPQSPVPYIRNGDGSILSAWGRDRSGRRRSEWREGRAA
jgi:hypothetical protein